MGDLFFHKTQLSDMEAIIALENSKENIPFILPNSKEEHCQLLSNKDVAHISLKNKNAQLVGYLLLAGLANPHKSIEFRRLVIHQKGKGFGRAAIKMVKDYCFIELNCHRLWLDVLETNARARHLYKSEGFIEEGRMRECILVEGKFNSLILMSMLKQEYK